MEKITFKVNGKNISVGGEVSSRTTLLEYLREYLELRGIKYLTNDGSCGFSLVCVVKSEGSNAVAVDASLVPVLCCDNWDVTTIELIGNKFIGYHDLQKELAKQKGNQCGYCSPSFIITMYCLLLNKNLTLTKLDIEKAFDSNFCRCNGYIPMLEAFKQFAVDNKYNLNKTLFNDRKTDEKIFDFEDEWILIHEKDLAKTDFMEIDLKDDTIWYRPQNITGVQEILLKIEKNPYKFVAGNTGKGLRPNVDHPNIFIDLNGIKELKGHVEEDVIILGAGNTITETIDIFNQLSSKDNYEYLNNLKNYLYTVANTAIRNVGTLAGDIMIKHDYKEYPSDIFVLFETVGATISIVDIKNSKTEHTFEEFLDIDMQGKLIVKIILPPLGKNHNVVFYRVMPKAQNTVAEMISGFYYKLESDGETVLDATLVFGGLSPLFNHASKTEASLIGKNLFSNDTLKKSLETLKDEVNVTAVKSFKVQLCLRLFYKGLITICPKTIVSPNHLSGAINLKETRPVSSVTSYGSDSNEISMKNPDPYEQKLIQCSGEALYTDDIPKLPREVFAAFVLSSCAVANIDKIDPALALAVEGVIAFYSAKDIPGQNSFTPINLPYYTQNEEVLADVKVQFCSQAVGIIAAQTLDIATYAASLVQVSYKNQQIPVTDVRIAQLDDARSTLFLRTSAVDKGDDVSNVVKGKLYLHGQCHFESEPQTCVALPSDDGIEVKSATQWIDGAQVAISKALKIQENCINQSVRRIGSSSGGKISNAAQVAVACSLVTMKLNRPCRMILPLEHCMKMTGKRLGASADFEAGVNDSGKIQYLNYNFYKNSGYMINQPFVAIGLNSVNNCYDKDRWNVNTYEVITDTAKNTWITSAGTFETISMIENIMEQISYEQALDPIQVRINNLGNDSDDDDNSETALNDIIDTIKDKTNYDTKKKDIETFNTENRWKKRGLGFAPVKWPIPNKGSLPLTDSFNVTMSVHQSDGTIVITHGGVEMGQGLDEQVIQICASTLGITEDYVKVKATNNISNVNSCFTSSISNEAITTGVKKCCKILEDRLAPIRLLVNAATWFLLIKAAYYRGINLTTNCNVFSNEKKQNYIYGATIAEVEVDILTGEKEILRVDLLQQATSSCCPAVDVSQIQAAFIMGIGYWTMEDLVFDKDGELLSDNGWKYSVPQARDIPQDFRIYLHDGLDTGDVTLGTKAASEPAICMAISVPFAIRSAIAASRLDSGLPKTAWFSQDGPCTVENIVNATDLSTKEFKF